MCDAFLEKVRETKEALRNEIHTLRDERVKALAVPKYQQQSAREMNPKTSKLSGIERVHIYLWFWEDILADSVSGWIMGCEQGRRYIGLTYVDIFLYELLHSTLGKQWLRRNGFGHLAKHQEAVEKRPGIAAYHSSNRPMPAFRLPDGSYIADGWDQGDAVGSGSK